MNIYVSGSIYGGTQKIDTYKILIEELEKYGEVLNKQIAIIPIITRANWLVKKEAMGNDDAAPPCTPCLERW